jgi:telomerase protein component 1
MYIRTCTNFILAFTILNQKTQPFVAKYFNKTVLIPGDLIEVCQFVQVINLINKGIAIEGIQDLRKKLYFPSLLRHCVASKLPEFTLYQLGKQCSDSNRKKTIKEYQEYLNPLLAESRKAKRKAKLETIHKAVNDTQNQDAIK